MVWQISYVIRIANWAFFACSMVSKISSSEVPGISYFGISIRRLDRSNVSRFKVIFEDFEMKAEGSRISRAALSGMNPCEI